MEDKEGKVYGKGHGASMPTTGSPFSQHLHIIANPEALLTSYFGDFVEASSHGHEPLIPVLALLSSRWGGLEMLSF